MPKIQPPQVGIMLRHVCDPGGVTVFTKRVVQRLLANPNGISYHLLYSDPAQREMFVGFPGTHVVIPSNSKVLWDQSHIPAYARKAGLDLVFNPKFSVPLFAPSQTIGVLPSAEQIVIPKLFPKWDYLYNKCFIPIYCRKASTMVTHTELGRQDLISRFGTEPNKIEVIPHGVDRWLRAASHEEQQRVISKYDLPKEYLLFLGGITPLKNIGNLLRAFNILAEQFPHLHLVLAGFKRWRYEEELTLIDTLNLRSRVHEIGFVADDDMAGLYSAAQCLLLPSWYEGFGIPIVEAMSCGTPVVTSNKGSCPEVAGGAAILVEPGNPEDIANGVKLLLTNDIARRKYVKAGLQRATQFDWDNSAMRIGNLIATLVAERRTVKKPQPIARIAATLLAPFISGVVDVVEVAAGVM